MPLYRAPLEDYRFVLTELFDVAQLSSLPTYAEATPDVVLSVLEEAGTFAEDVLFPINQSGDAEGCTWDNGNVRTPTGFMEAFRQYAEGGWVGLAADPAYGGQGLPILLRIAVDELVLSGNLSFAMYPSLTQGAFDALHAHGTDDLKARYLPKLAAGDWTGTMCLTEPHAGTDLGMIRTKAQPMDDGSALITGTKIFITAGDHDLVPNIIHMVLAKLPDAPPGSKGISMFLVPKFLVNADGSLGPRNGVTCGSIEHKMGIKGSATCVLNFDGARGWLVSEPHKGLRAMFTMMNSARLGVGMQGLALAEVAYQNAVAYARERVQGRNLSGARNPSGPADPIVTHADIRRGLLWMRAFVQGARALAMFTALRLDEEHRHPEATVREEAADLVALLTPIIKAFFTDLAFDATNIGLQTLGGHGYIREFGMEQLVRDARIGQIYEGTNHIQALDLVGRKLGEGNGRLLKRYAAIVANEIAIAKDRPETAELAAGLAEAAKLLQISTGTIAQRGAKDPSEAGGCASEYLRLFGYVALGHMWLRAARVASERRGSGGAMSQEFYAAKLGTARFYFRRMMPATAALAQAITAGSESILEFPEEAF
jgi:alkylation response protein AidB-like acyl-CoA dehydrogenase